MNGLKNATFVGNFFPVISKEVYDNIRAKLLDLSSHNEILMKSKAST